MFDSQEYRQDRPQGLKKKEIINIKKTRPGRLDVFESCGSYEKSELNPKKAFRVRNRAEVGMRLRSSS